MSVKKILDVLEGQKHVVLRSCTNQQETDKYKQRTENTLNYLKESIRVSIERKAWQYVQMQRKQAAYQYSLLEWLNSGFDNYINCWNCHKPFNMGKAKYCPHCKEDIAPY